ncbi:MAG: TRAP transporter small permease subunit [Synergistaceae bacterium]|jgi:TRAP-type C4-dicarboxylate transport system permease small subunit|nr:TRAP transporter small permease subunit [Synergistaceae bacterium]
MKKIYLKFVRCLFVFETAMAAFGLLFATFTIMAQILNRYWLHFPVIWLADVSLFVYVFCAFFAIPLATGQDSHINVDVFTSFAVKGEKAKKVVKILINLLCLTFLCLLFPVFYAYFLRAIKYPEWATLVTWLNTSWMIEALFVAFVLNIFHMFHNTVAQILSLCGISEGGAGK